MLAGFDLRHPGRRGLRRRRQGRRSGRAAGMRGGAHREIGFGQQEAHRRRLLGSADRPEQQLGQGQAVIQSHLRPGAEDMQVLAQRIELVVGGVEILGPAHLPHRAAPALVLDAGQHFLQHPGVEGGAVGHQHLGLVDDGADGAKVEAAPAQHVGGQAVGIGGRRADRHGRLLRTVVLRHFAQQAAGARRHLDQQQADADGLIGWREPGGFGTDDCDPHGHSGVTVRGPARRQPLWSFASSVVRAR
ncbi:hypothetical protein CBM2586_A50398 [Cupriavidus phytorum]|uniref:Uncharacterized protein n=1 Tax=Cupriavidus taiwanensis TaxID=164546 RepID=A0A375C3C9_9BURK|nr:hypothetical protein CBM2586_A50398 [Cupriavidus taiwanensis]